MKKTLLTDLKLLRYFPLIMLGLSALTLVLKIFVRNDSFAKLDQNTLTFNISDTVFIFLIACVFYILTQKYDNLRKYKLTAWYDTLPVSIKDIQFSNFILVIVPHILLFIFACLYYAINDDFNMHLNLSDNKYWHFYLYQMPYIVTAIGIIICITSLFIVRKR